MSDRVVDVSIKAREILSPTDVELVIYHKHCPDGFGAAFAAWLVLGNDVDYVAASFDESPPDVTGRRVAIFDFSYKKPIMEEMKRRAAAIVLLDHHKSAEEDLRGLDFVFFAMDKSGARLAWDYFHGGTGRRRPKLIDYIEDRDLWRWKMPDSREYNAALSQVVFDFKAFHYVYKHERETTPSLIACGIAILKNADALVQKIAQGAYARRLRGHTVNVVNSYVFVSELGNLLAQTADVGMVWRYDGTQRSHVVSLRATREHVDVSALATVFGGGGHPKASGFRWEADIESLFDAAE